MEIAAASPADADDIAAIYAHHVLRGTASFETEPPTAEFWRGKIADLAARGWPFLVAKVDGQLSGYAYATQFRDRAAYRFTCENSIYVHPAWLGRGVGKALVERLLERAPETGF